MLYKQTHFGDPDPLRGVWGDTDCMGIVRNRDFDAVIGIGGDTAEPWIAGKLTWAARGPHQIGQIAGNRILNFDHFLHMGSKGPLLETDYPLIARRMREAGRGPVSHSLGATRFDQEIESILLVLIRFAPPSTGSTPSPRGRC